MKQIALHSAVTKVEIYKVDSGYILTLNDNEISRDTNRENIIKQFDVIALVLNSLGIHVEFEYYI